MKKQVEMSIQDGNGNEFVAYPKTHKEHVQFENGMNIDEFVGQDIATPTITHDTTAIKVGVGDSDVSSSVVDSTVNMTIKGQTYQNILPDPTLRNEMQGKSMQRLNEGYDSIETVDGVSKSAILKGQTLVNVDSYYSMDDFSDRQITSLSDDGWIEIVANGNYRNAFTRFNGMIKPNTKYLAVVEVKENTLVNETFPERPFYLFTNYSNPDGGVVVPFADQTEWISQGQKGLFKYILTSRGDLSTATVNLRNFVTNTTTSGRIIYRTMLIEYVEGMENWDIPFFRGIQSVKMPVLQTYDGNIMRLSPPQLTTNGVTIEKVNDVEFLFNQGSRQGSGGWKWNIPNGEAFTLSFYYEKVSGCENQCQVHVSCAGGIPDKIDLSEPFGQFEKTYYVRRTTPTFVEFKPVGEITSTKSVLKISNLKWYIGNKVYSDKTNILRTPEEVVLRSLPSGVCDTLNLNTGEYVQRTGKIILNGSEEWAMDNEASDSKENTSIFYSQKFTQFKKLEMNERNSGIVCNGYPVKGDVYGSDVEGMMFNHVNVFYFRVKKSVANNVGDFEQWLSQNPKEVQLELATPIIKTVDLSSHGNWEKVVLDGSETGWSNSYNKWANKVFCLNNSYLTNVIKPANTKDAYVMCDKLRACGIGWLCDELGRTGIALHNWSSSYLQIAIKGVNTVDELKQYLSQNPITVWYQTTTTQDNSIREMLSFANGHLQVSSEAENSLLPSVQYEIPTKNSYHMDLMKTNTLYTMKAKSVSGTFTIDGTSYNVNTNGTFTSPSSMTDKLLIMSNKTNEEVMLLKGNVIDKTIPYFKGIKSAFEGEDKIEVLSVGKNLANIATQGETNFYIGYIEKGVTYSLKINRDAQVTYNLVLKPHLNSDANQTRIASGITENFIVFTSPSNGYLFFNGYSRVIVSDIILTRGEYTSQTMPSFEPYITNTTKIPLLSPLRSLPNGICDELIIDRLNHKVKLIQRIGYEVLNENTAFSSYPTMEKEKTLLFQTQNAIPQGASTYCISDQFIHGNNIWGSSDSDTEAIMIGGGEGNIGKHIDFRISKAKVSTNNVAILQDYLSKEPITVLYQLNIPIITEIDLEGYPYIYKDGHIFLNSDIAPTTQITYSINQAQQIESANENLQRHEKEISHLQKLIAQYIQVEYESTLLSLKI